MNHCNEKVIFVNGGRRRHRVDVYALGNDNTILACLNGYGNGPELPGGGIDKNESPETAAIREMMEEAGWTGVNAVVLNIRGKWIFNGKDDGWFNRAGWTEEENIAVVCNAIRFTPNSLYGVGNDALVFELVPIDALINSVNTAILNGLNPRKQLLSEFRLAVLEELKILISNRPPYANW